jgi:dolichol kinase
MNTSIRSEYMRKTIHIVFTCIVLVFGYLPTLAVYAIYFVCLIFMLTYEYMRRHHASIQRILESTGLAQIVRPHEAHGLTGATYVVCACLIGYSLFPLHIFILSILIMGVGDTAAALIGRHWGRPNHFGKSLAGSVAFFLTSLVIVFVAAMVWSLSSRFVVEACVASYTAMLAERYSSLWKIDDNLSIPLVFGASMYCLSHLL